MRTDGQSCETSSLRSSACGTNVDRAALKQMQSTRLPECSVDAANLVMRCLCPWTLIFVSGSDCGQVMETLIDWFFEGPIVFQEFGILCTSTRTTSSVRILINDVCESVNHVGLGKSACVKRCSVSEVYTFHCRYIWNKPNIMSDNFLVFVKL